MSIHCVISVIPLAAVQVQNGKSASKVRDSCNDAGGTHLRKEILKKGGPLRPEPKNVKGRDSECFYSVEVNISGHTEEIQDLCTVSQSFLDLSSLSYCKFNCGLEVGLTRVRSIYHSKREQKKQRGREAQIRTSDLT